MRLLSWDETQLLYWGGPIAIINTVKNNHTIVPIRTPMKEYFVCEYGIYMVDTQTQYRYNKQPISFYASHNETIPKKLVAAVEKAYIKKDYVKLRKELEKIYPNLIKGKEFSSIYDIFYKIVEHTNHFAIDLDTEKYLPHMEAFSPQAIRNLYITGQDAMKAIDKLSPPKLPPKAIPIGIALMVGIVAIAVIQNLPKWIRELRAEFGNIGKPPELLLGLQQYLPEPPELLLGLANFF